MLPIPPAIKGIVFVVLVFAIGGFHALGPVEPTWTWVGVVVQVLTGVELLVTVPPAAARKLAAISSKVTGPLVVIGALVTGGTSLACSGCGAGQTVSVPPQAVDTGICIVETISIDLANGQSFPVAVDDAAAKCLTGGSRAITDADRASVTKMWTAHIAAEDLLSGKDGGK